MNLKRKRRSHDGYNGINPLALIWEKEAYSSTLAIVCKNRKTAADCDLDTFFAWVDLLPPSTSTEVTELQQLLASNGGRSNNSTLKQYQQYYQLDSGGGSEGTPAAREGKSIDFRCQA